MFHAEYDLYRSNAENTINKIINEIDLLEDELVRIESLAEVFAKLSLLNSAQFQKKVNFIYARLLDLTKALYQTTALQFEISEYFLQTIGKQNPRFALKIISQMNNVERREGSRLHVLNAYLNNDFNYIKIDVIKDLEKSLEEPSSKFELCLDTLERFAEAKSLDAGSVLQLLYFQNNILQNPIINERLRGLLLMFKILQKDNTWKNKLTTKWGGLIFQCWKTLESDWERIDEGFSLCYELAKFEPTLSKKLFSESEQIKNASWLDSKAVAYTYLNSINLIIRAFNGLMITGLNTTEDFQIIEDLIARVPSEFEKLRLWSELGFYAFIAGKDKLFKKVINERIIHLIHSLSNKKLNLTTTLISLTLLHLANPILASKYIEQLSNEEKERVYYNTCRFYVTKHNPYEPYEPKIIRYSSTFSDLTAAVSVLAHVKVDTNIYYLIDQICSAIKRNDNEISKTQVAEVVSDLHVIINNSLPDRRNILHNGFKISAKLQVAKVSKHLNIQPSFWQDLLKEIDSIPNLSDIIFVKAIFLEDFPFDKIQNGSQVKRMLFDSTIKDLEKLPVHYEFVERVIDITDQMYSYDPKIWKKCVDQAFNISAGLKDGSEIFRSQRSIIDSMYRLDPNYAKELIKQVDSENQQKKINKLLIDHYQKLEIANKIKNNKTLEQKEKENSEKIVESVYMTLKGLNSDRVLPKKVSEIIGYLQIGNQLPLHEIFPVYMYYLSNCSKMYRSAKDDNIIKLHKENFREMVSATNLIQLLSQKKKNTEKSYRKFFIDEDFASNKPIKPRSRDEAFKFIKDWLNEQTEDFIIIADPYFEKEDLEILKLIKQANVNVEVDILGSKDFNLENCETQYKQYWKKISDEDAPFVNVTFCRTGGNREPFHDRWIITKDSGLRLGTSINSLGMNKESEISVMKPNEALKIREQTLNEFITRRKREINNERLSYNGFTMN
jgi:hypothetical protein